MRKSALDRKYSDSESRTEAFRGAGGMMTMRLRVFASDHSPLGRDIGEEFGEMFHQHIGIDPGDRHGQTLAGENST